MAIITGWEQVQTPQPVLYETSTVLAANTDYDTPSVGESPSSGDWIEVGQLKELVLAGIADQVSDSSGVVVEESLDGVNVHKTTLAVSAAIDTYIGQIIELTGKYVRCRWQNGATLQGSFNFRVIGRY